MDIFLPFQRISGLMLMNHKRNRWYDSYPDLSELLEALKELDRGKMNIMLRNVKKIITDTDGDLINNTVMKYPLGIDRRWYDKDPLSWMTINALKFADDSLRKRVVAFIAGEMRNSKRREKMIAG